MKKTPFVLAIVVVALLAGMPTNADEKHDKGRRGDRDEDRQEEHGHDRDRDARQAERRGFSDDEREKIHRYCDQLYTQGGKHHRSLPPGLAKKVGRGGSLPPGWADKCRPGETMPVEVYRECTPLPPELTVRLPAPPVGTVTVAVDGRVVRLMQATREILDVFNVPVRF